MINQKPISAKLDIVIADMLEQEAYTSGVSKNRIINKAIMHYIEDLDAQRRRRCGLGAATDAADAEAMELGKYILENLTGEQHAHIRFSAKGVGCSPEHLMYRLIVGALEDFRKRPFSYL